MPKRNDLKKVMVVGSGPIIIGQAAEFDYAGTQACKALREEGISVVLINSNPATIMTDVEVADKVYIEPINVEFATRVIERERPDGLLPTLGGQTGLNLAVELASAGVLTQYNVEMLGTPLAAIQDAEDRLLFRSLMQNIGEPVPESWIVERREQLQEIIDSNPPWPLIVRPAYTLGGTGGGVAFTPEELLEIGSRGLKLSLKSQVMIERCLLGWKEVEYEVMRDSNDTCITICSMENFDPMGVHTGDSIVVAPMQTLTDKEYQMLRSASLKIIRALKIEGGCNVQLALNPKSFEYYVIEVNPRVSRSSALASKATGYPIARVAAKIAVGLHLDEISNAVTGKTKAAFEPTIDYIVAKIPRWPFDKFYQADRTIGTQMKATGEVMSIDRTFEAAIMKAVRSLEIGLHWLRLKNADELTDADIEEKVRVATDERLFVIAEALRRNWTIERIAELSNVDPWFLHKLQNIVNMERELAGRAAEIKALTSGRVASEPGALDLLKRAKSMRFPDKIISQLTGANESQLRWLQKKLKMLPTYKMVDTCAAEFEAETPYFYSCHEVEDETGCLESVAKGMFEGVSVRGFEGHALSNPPTLQPSNSLPGSPLSTLHSPLKKAIVIGSGPIRIGQGVEFDYCSVHSAWALREAGYESIIVNNNPETVSTDFDTSDRLYFEPLTVEDVLNIVEYEQPDGVILQFGGQTAINLAKPLNAIGVPIFGSDFKSIDIAEDRDKFERILRELDIPKPAGRAIFGVDAAVGVAKEIGYPVLVRPSYVLGGQAMEIVYTENELKQYMKHAVDISPDPDAPILVDKYVMGKEVEVDVIADGVDCLIPGIMEHIERAGVHSGDSMAVCPPQTLSQDIIDQIISHSIKLAMALEVRGLMNIQFVLDDDEVQVIEVNPRASRTVPYLSKITGVPMIQVATNVVLGKSLKDQGYKSGLYRQQPSLAVKAPVFSFSKLTEVDVSLGPEMKSTGEIMGIDRDFSRALYKAMVACNLDAPVAGKMIATIADQDKEEAAPIIREFVELGYEVYATEGTARYLASKGVATTEVGKINDPDSLNMMQLIAGHKVDLLINTASKDKKIEQEASVIRKASVQRSIPCLTSLDTAKALLQALRSKQRGDRPECLPVDAYLEGAKV
ncbi:MAG: carbamoyl-phosphate synthase large subunit [Armatimonadetes bacterium]|nr:carbamoyl-phosphate synthase large subunit [Armatimonadota bacterium]